MCVSNPIQCFWFTPRYHSSEEKEWFFWCAGERICQIATTRCRTWPGVEKVQDLGLIFFNKCAQVNKRFLVRGCPRGEWRWSMKKKIMTTMRIWVNLKNKARERKLYRGEFQCKYRWLTRTPSLKRRLIKVGKNTQGQPKLAQSILPLPSHIIR